MNHKILIVDDESPNLRILERLFRTHYEVLTASSGAHGLELLLRHDVALIISDQRMPEMTGIEFLKKSAELRKHTVRIILTGYTDLSDLVEAINSGVIYKYITKPWVNTDLQQTVHRGVEHYETLKAQHLRKLEIERLTERLAITVEATIEAMNGMLTQNFPQISQHCRRTANYATLIAQRLNVSPAEIRHLVVASLLHEIPHLRNIPDNGYPADRMTAEQYEALRADFEIGLDLISNIPDLEDVALTIRFQHEHFDGSGYFERLDGEKIPLSSRILSVANAFDDITSGRHHRMFLTDQQTASWFLERSGSHFDPQVVKACLESSLSVTKKQPAPYFSQMAANCS